MKFLFLHNSHIFYNKYVCLVWHKDDILRSLRVPLPTESSRSIDPYQWSRVPTKGMYTLSMIVYRPPHSSLLRISLFFS